MAIVQARNEALFTRAEAVEPRHLVLGVLHLQNDSQLARLFPDPVNLDILRRALGGSRRPAPVVPEDIGYHISSREALDGATRLAAESPAGPDTLPLHILLGIFRPWSVELEAPGTTDQVALDLAATGLGETRLRELLLDAREEP
jgi:hypothetical protein